MKDNCEKFREMMFDYITDGNGGDFSELEEHLAVCAPCRDELDECKKMTALLAECAPTPPSEIKTNVMLAVAADAKLRRRKRLMKTVSAAAAVFVLCAGVWIAAVASGVGKAFDAEVNMSGNADAPSASGGIGGDCIMDDALHDAEMPENDGLEYGTTDSEKTDVFESEAAKTAEMLKNEYGYTSPVIFVLKGTDADDAYEALARELGGKDEDGVLILDADSADRVSALIEELAGRMKVWFCAYAASETPDVTAVYVGN